MKKDISVIISIIAIVLSIVTIILFFVKVSPNSVVDSNTFIGVCTACIGIAVTFIIGYQIINALQIKQKFSNLEEASTKLEKLYNKSKKKRHKQNRKMNEGFTLIMALKRFTNNDPRAQLGAFLAFHEALILSVKTNRANFDWIFSYMRRCIFKITNNSFKKITITQKGKKADYNSSDALKEVNKIIVKNERRIKKADGFRSIKIEYNRVMELYEKRISDICENKLHENHEFWEKEEKEENIEYF